MSVKIGLVESILSREDLGNSSSNDEMSKLKGEETQYSMVFRESDLLEFFFWIMRY